MTVTKSYLKKLFPGLVFAEKLPGQSAEKVWGRRCGIRHSSQPCQGNGKNLKKNRAGKGPHKPGPGQKQYSSVWSPLCSLPPGLTHPDFFSPILFTPYEAWSSPLK